MHNTKDYTTTLSTTTQQILTPAIVNKIFYLHYRKTVQETVQEITVQENITGNSTREHHITG